MNAGGLSPYGTMAQAGNVWEWLETPIDLSSPQRYYRGTAWHNAQLSNQHFSTDGNTIGTLGIRVASIAVPEPSTLALAVMAFAALSLRRRDPMLRKFAGAIGVTLSALVKEWERKGWEKGALWISI